MMMLMMMDIGDQDDGCGDGHPCALVPDDNDDDDDDADDDGP
jgi:hypothetical protein